MGQSFQHRNSRRAEIYHKLALRVPAAIRKCAAEAIQPWPVPFFGITAPKPSVNEAVLDLA